MTWDALDSDIREAALEVCEPEEIDVLRLYSHGWGFRKIARSLNIDRDTARNRFNRAVRKLRQHLGEGRVDL